MTTLLILELHVPHLSDPTVLSAVWHDVLPLLPKFITFGFSFVVLCIFWVNHHHFYHQLEHADWPLLWHNCNLLFWMSIVPFSTAFLGEYHDVPLALSFYAFVLCMSALAFRLMMRHAFFHSALHRKDMALDARQKAYTRTLWGILGYAAAVLLAFLSVWASWAMLIFVPLFYFVPRLTHATEVDEV